MHIDAAYAGSAFICPEYRHLLNGVEVSRENISLIFGLNDRCLISCKIGILIFRISVYLINISCLLNHHIVKYKSL